MCRFRRVGYQLTMQSLLIDWFGATTWATEAGCLTRLENNAWPRK